MKRSLSAGLVVSAFLIDRALKAAVLDRWSEGESLPVVPGVFHLTRVNNTGAAFGILDGATPFLIAVSAVCALVLAWLVFRPSPSTASSLRRWAFPLLLAGALGNLYDRLCYGYVLDFIDLRIWPVFNAADLCITAGVCLLIAAAAVEKRT